MKNQLFNVIQIKKPRTNVFDLSHEKKLSFNMGELVPIFMEDVVPGDKFRVNTEMLIRMAPMIAPVMHRVNVYTHFFFVPYRLLWSNWEKFITGGETGNETPTFPTVLINNDVATSFNAGRLADYLGIPATDGKTISNSLQISALPFRAYQLIYNEYYRDQNLQTAIAITKNDTVGTPELAVLLTLRNRAWEKDYFTSALPWTQRGGEVTLPNAPDYKDTSDIYRSNGTDPASGNLQTSGSYPHKMVDSSGSATLRVENLDGIEISINDLRSATRLQRWLEKNARGGSRYVEQILSHFGVKSSDARLQRPEYLGGGKSPIVISEVLNTSATATEPQGNMAGHGIGVGNTNSFQKYFEEHGLILGIMSVLPRTAYQQGIEKLWTKFDKFDYYFPEFANLGEQEVKVKELYTCYDGTNYNETTFGYQPRYSEYKFKNSSYHGDFRNTLAYWHLARIFASKPSLNSSFVTSDPSHRIFAVTDPTKDKLYCQLYNNVRAIRPMPVFGTPTL